VAVKLAEKAIVDPGKLMQLIEVRAGAAFTPSGVLKMDLTEDELDRLLETVRGLLLQVRTSS